MRIDETKGKIHPFCQQKKDPTYRSLNFLAFYEDNKDANTKNSRIHDSSNEFDALISIPKMQPPKGKRKRKK